MSAKYWVSEPKHPGRTPAQRKALDVIGTGLQPMMGNKTRLALLNAGLIHVCERKRRRDALGSYEIEVYEMPVHVHMQWCERMAWEHDNLPEDAQ